MKLKLEINGFQKPLDLYYRKKHLIHFFWKFLLPYIVLYLAYVILFKFYLEEHFFLPNFSHDKLMLYILYTNLFHFFAASLTLGISFATLGGAARKAFVQFLKLSRYNRINIIPSKEEDASLKNMANHFNNLLSSYNLRFKHIRKNVVSIKKELNKMNKSKKNKDKYTEELESIQKFLDNYS